MELLKTTPADILKPFWLTLEIPQRIEMKRLAESFLETQQERHRADYDLSHSFTRAEVLVVLERVEQATKDWETVKKQHPKVAQFFALAMIMMESWRKR